MKIKAWSYWVPVGPCISLLDSGWLFAITDVGLCLVDMFAAVSDRTSKRPSSVITSNQALPLESACYDTLLCQLCHTRCYLLSCCPLLLLCVTS